MRVPLSWLTEHVQTSADARAIADVLTARGFVVDAIELQPTPARIVVGKVETLERHPNADRLRVGTVDVGNERLQIVTGAENVAAGNRVPIALLGAEVYEHGATDGAAGSTKTIRASALRGVESNGMMCSSTELALPGEFEDGILILDDDAPIGEDFWRAVRFGGAVLDVDVPSNRPDCLSIIGLAREVAAGLDVPWREPQFEENTGTAVPAIKVSIDDETLCRRFVGQQFSGVGARRSPMWLTLRLHAAGIRSIDLLVDISNYAMLETGQPLHFYDAARIRGGVLAARGAREGERVVTLDGVVRPLPLGAPVIADAQGVVGVAGVFGGESSGVADSTTDLFVEAANFAGAAVRRAAVALGLRTEASARHEKDLPLEYPELGRRAAAALFVAAGAVPSRVIDVGQRERAPKKIAVRPARVNTVLGTDLTADAMTQTLATIGFTVKGSAPLQVTPPYWRGDVNDEIDVVEEIARGTGFDSIAEQRDNASPQDVDESLFDQETLLAHRTAALGYHEVIALALQGSRTIAAWERSGLPFWKTPVPVVNPLSDEQRFLRPSLLPGMLEIAARTWKRAGGELRLFEIGHIFRQAEGEPAHAHHHDPSNDVPLPPAGAYETAGVIEWPSLCALAVFASDASENAAIDRRLLQVKGEAEALVTMLAGTAGETRSEARGYFHPGASGAIEIDGRPVAKFGRLHPRLAAAYDLPQRSYAFMLHPENLPATKPVVAYRPLPKFPGTQRDIAVVVDGSVESGELMAAVRGADAPAFEDVRAFDEYRGPQVPGGKKSVALTVRLRKLDTTITDAEADAAMTLIINALRERFGATLRGDAS
jgi:phenylalanyl-tRNA synthetase beta chain